MSAAMRASQGAMTAVQPTVLLVDDDPADQELVRRAFAQGHFECALEVASDGNEALLRARGEGAFAGRPAPSLLLVDLNMPRIDGIDLVRALRRDPRTQGMPIVVLSTSSRPADVKASYAAGASAYIQKPDGFDGVHAVLRRALDFWFGVVRLPG